MQIFSLHSTSEVILIPQTVGKRDVKILAGVLPLYLHVQGKKYCGNNP